MKDLLEYKGVVGIIAVILMLVNLFTGGGKEGITLIFCAATLALYLADKESPAWTKACWMFNTIIWFYLAVAA